MEIDLTELTASQKHALFELLILAMYTDGHLTIIEEDRLQKLLASMGYAEESDRQREFDAAVTRVRPFVESVQKAKDRALELARTFTVRVQQKQVYAAVEEIMTTDRHLSSWESTLLSELRLKFRL